MSFVIPAEVHRDDFQFEASFDALEWFKQASDEEILALAACDWGGDYPADEVAQFFDTLAFYNPEVGCVLDNTTAEEGMGFECHVESAAAMRWLKDNKPNLWLTIEVA